MLFLVRQIPGSIYLFLRNVRTQSAAEYVLFFFFFVGSNQTCTNKEEQIEFEIFVYSPTKVRKAGGGRRKVR